MKTRKDDTGTAEDRLAALADMDEDALKVERLRQQTIKLQLENDQRAGVLINRDQSLAAVGVALAALMGKLYAVGERHGPACAKDLRDAVDATRRYLVDAGAALGSPADDAAAAGSEPSLLDDDAKVSRAGRPRKAVSELKRPRSRAGKAKPKVSAPRTRGGGKA